MDECFEAQGLLYVSCQKAKWCKSVIQEKWEVHIWCHNTEIYEHAKCPSHSYCFTPQSTMCQGRLRVIQWHWQTKLCNFSKWRKCNSTAPVLALKKICILPKYIFCGWNSINGMATRLCVGQSVVEILGGVRCFSHLQNIWSTSRAHQASYSLSTWFFPGVKQLRLRMNWAIPVLPICAFMAGQGNFIFTFMTVRINSDYFWKLH